MMVATVMINVIWNVTPCDLLPVHLEDGEGSFLQNIIK
jgi:hypothetical protein